MSLMRKLQLRAAASASLAEELATLGGPGSGPRKVSPKETAALKKIDLAINKPEFLKLLRIPNKLQHVTERTNLASIQGAGLKLGQTRGSTEGVIRGIYLSKDGNQVIAEQGDVATKSPIVVDIKSQDLKLRMDPEYYRSSLGDAVDKASILDYVKNVNRGEEPFAVYTTSPIPATHVGNIHDGYDGSRIK